MKMDRNIPGNNGRGKYALLLLRRLEAYEDQNTFGGLRPDIAAALKTLEDAGIIDWGIAETESEFFLIRLKDRCAQAALLAYAREASTFDVEWAAEVERLGA